jgi:serine/threonine-protein kinase
MTASGRIEPLLAREHHDRLAETFRPGVVLQDRFRIERELGRGGMGQVYLATDSRLDRPVAIKVSVPLAQPQDLNREQLESLCQAFAEEARLGANLTHPAIATVYDYGFHGDKPFTVFEYLDGQTLGGLLRSRGRLTLEEVRLIIGPLAQALDFAHGRQVVHRDLKPENIRATEQGQFKILDLGLARRFQHDSSWSGFEGTPAYASPEQAAGKACDGRTDQYALALITFELLTGHRLFQSNDPLVLLQLHREAPPTGVDQALPDTPEAIRQALIRALSKSPNDRFDTCVDFAVALGCQLLNVTAPTAEIVRETDLKSMTIGRYGKRVSLARLPNSVHLVLTRDRLWSVYHTEIHDWPLARIREVAPRTRPGAGIEEAERTRRDHLGTESAIEQIGFFHYLGAILALAVLVASIFPIPDRAWEWRQWRPVVIGVSALMTIALAIVGRGLRRRRSWARRTALVGGSASLLALVVGLVTSSGVLHEWGKISYLLMLFLLASPFLVLIAVEIFTLSSPRARMVSSAAYKDVVAQTSHVKVPLEQRWGPWQSTLRLTVETRDGALQTVAFRFPTPEACRTWALCLERELASLPADPAFSGWGTPTSKAVVLMRRRPQIRYQLLGPLEVKAVSWRIARDGLQVRAAMIGADAVIDLQKESLPGFQLTVRRLSGTAVRAVDEDGRIEFQSRWYAQRLSRICSLAAIYLAIRFLGYCQGTFLGIQLETTHRGIVDGAESFHLTAEHLSQAATFLAASHAIPLGLVCLAWILRWPQLVRPMAVSIAALALSPVYQLIGISAGALGAGGWSGAAYELAWQLNPISLALLLFGCFLARTAWRAHRDFRSLVAPERRRSPVLRIWLGALAWAVAVVFAATLAGLTVQREYRYVSHFRLPTEFNSKVAEAERQVRFAWELTDSSPKEAQPRWQRAVEQWEEVVRASPADARHQEYLEHAYFNLGYVLHKQHKLDEAVAAYRQAIRVRPEDVTAHLNLGIALFEQGHLDQAIAEFRAAIQLNPHDHTAHYWIGYLRHAQGRLDEAIEAYRQAIRIQPGDVRTRASLGSILALDGRLDEAIAEFREAVRLKPDVPEYRVALGRALQERGQVEAAIAELRKAVELRPGDATARAGLAHFLKSRGDFASAVEEFRRSRDLAGSRPELAQWIDVQLTSARRQAALVGRVPAVVRGEDTPKDAAESIDFAVVCYGLRRFAASARLYSLAFEARPELAADLSTSNRYNAACSAALAAEGKGEQDQPLDSPTRARWRAQALSWLRADLTQWAKFAHDRPTPVRPPIRPTLQHWKTDADLAGIRDEGRLSTLGAEEQKAIQSLWADVDFLLSRVKGRASP